MQHIPNSGLLPARQEAEQKMFQLAVDSAKRECLKVEGNLANWKNYINVTPIGRAIRPDILASVE